MKVLWFTNVPLPQVADKAGIGTRGSGGHWMAELFAAVAGRPDIKLGVATAFPGLRDLKFEQDGATFYAVGQRRRAPTFTGTAAELDKCAAIARDFDPDLLHFHGSERFFGLLKADGRVRTPAVLSMQGLLGPCSTFRRFFGGLGLCEIARSIRLVELPLRLGLLWQFVDTRRGARNEARILSAMDGVLGRTEWDEAYLRSLNRKALYFKVGEILRPPFYRARWNAASCEPHTLIFTNAGHPLRGVPNLLSAAAILRDEFPSLKLRLAGHVSERSGYGRFVRRRIRDLGLRDCVEFLGYLDAGAMAEALARSNVFAITSYIENSPNSLAEAMLVGMPCVASFAGGIPSLVQHDETGLLYAADDVTMLAGQIRRLFLDRDTAVRLATAAREVASARHDPERVVGQLMAAYRDIAGR